MIPVPWQQLLDGPAGRVLDALRPGPRTADEVATALGITVTGARQHLGKLQGDGLVVLAAQRTGHRKPFHQYRLTTLGEQALSRAYLPLLKAMVDSVGEQLSPDQTRQLFTRIGQLLARKLPPPQANAPAADIARTALHHLGGSARLHSDDGRVTLEGEGCPLAELVRQTPITCEAVRSLLEETLARPVTRCCHDGDEPRCGFAFAE